MVRYRWAQIAFALMAVSGCSVRGVPAVAAGSLPAGDGRGILERECLSCHELDALELFSDFYSRDQWRSLVITMRGNGAQVDDDEVEVLATYLARHFGIGE